MAKALIDSDGVWTRRAFARTFLTSASVAMITAPGVAATRMRIVPFATSPFPYDGLVPDTGVPFLDTMQGTQKAHTSARGGIYALEPTYSDRSVLLALSRRLAPRRAALVVFLHGNGTRLDRDVIARQHVLAQFIASHFDGALVVPQFALDALDSSAGHFWDPDGFERFMAEADQRLAQLARRPVGLFTAMPVVLVAYSGGHNPAAAILSRGDPQRRIQGVFLLDALYDFVDVFATWIVGGNGRRFFFSAYTKSSKARNIALEDDLREKGIIVEDGIPDRIRPGTVAFHDSGIVDHTEFMTHAWTEDPLRFLLARTRVHRL